MPRPPSTPGGRPHRVTIRLSADELAQLDQLRAGVPVNDYIRARLFKTTTTTTTPTRVRTTTKHNWTTDDHGEGRCTVCNVLIDDNPPPECTGEWVPDLRPARKAVETDGFDSVF